MFSFIATILISLVTAYAIEKYILNYNYYSRSTFQQNLIFVFIVLLSVVIYVMPIIIKMLINSSTYEEEKERLEHNFISQKEADIVAYREKYQDYAKTFNDANIKMNSIKQLSEISKEYHKLIENVQKETFDFLNKLAKSNVNGNILLNECKIKVEEEFKMTLEKMSKAFNSI
jgi:hypothetical protein